MKYKRSALAMLVILLAGLAGSGCYRTEAPPDTRSAEKKAEAEWFNKKAKELKGNFDMLSEEEKQRAAKVSGSEREARIGFGFAAGAK